MQLGIREDFARARFQKLLKWGLTVPKAKINKGQPLFPRIV